MRTQLAAFLVAIVPLAWLAQSVFVNADTKNNPLEGWKEFSPKDKSFSVWLPDKGGRRSERERTLFVSGMRLKYNLVELELNDGPTLAASTIIMPFTLARKIPPNERIEIFRDAIVKDVTGRIEADKDIKQGRVSGKEYLIETGQGAVKVRLYALGGRIYKAMVKGTKDQVESRDAVTFLDSYKLPALATDEPAAKNDPKITDPKKGSKSVDTTPFKAGDRPAWTTDLAKMKFPESAGAGKILGQDFMVESAKLEPSGALTLSKGKGIVPDMAILIFLKPGEAIEGKTYEIRKDTPPLQRPPIHLRAMLPGKNVPATQAFVLGYAMKLEFGNAKDGTIPGKIYVCLPDDGRSVVAGTFVLKRP